MHAFPAFHIGVPHAECGQSSRVLPHWMRLGEFLRHPGWAFRLGAWESDPIISWRRPFLMTRQEMLSAAVSIAASDPAAVLI